MRLLALLLLSGCTKGPFTYAVHSAPVNALALHDPLFPEAGAPVSVEVLVEASTPVAGVEATVIGPGLGSTTVPCAAGADGWWTCDAVTPTADGELYYTARVTTAAGQTGQSPTVRTRIGAPPADQRRMTWVPITPSRTGGQATMEVLVAPMPSLGLPLSSFDDRLHDLLREDLFGDPAWRRRASLLGIWTTTHLAHTRSYEVGVQARCGGDPWPEEPGVPPWASGVDVIGILHAEGGAAGAAEGEGPPGAFRDCAGTLAADPSISTFSAHVFKNVFRHELGHAMLGLGDEYYESEDTRRVEPAPAEPDGQACCCCASSDGPGDGTVGPGGGGGVPGVGALYCIQEPGGAPVSSGVCGGLPVPSAAPTCSPSAATHDFPQQCHDEPLDEPVCPPLASTCVASRHFLGATPAAPVDRFNVFATEGACEAARTRALGHPGVPDAADGLGRCRQLCGPGTGLDCPCVTPDVSAWIVDVSPNAPGNDAMATVSPAPNHHGSTDRVCLETSLCVRWERARGLTADEAWARCEAP